MAILDWTFVLLLAIAILSALVTLLHFFRFLILSKKGKRFKRPTPKRNRKKFLSQKRYWLARKKRVRTLCLLFFLSTVLIGGGAFVTRNFQQNSLPAEDASAVAQSYFTLNELANQLDNFASDENRVKATKNIQNLASTLNASGLRSTSTLLTVPKQKLLNKYYAAVRQLGANLENQSEENLASEGVLAGYQEDIASIKTYQAEIFDVFDINESALEARE